MKQLSNGICPLCGEGWVMLDGKLNRRLFAGEPHVCARCHQEMIAIPEGSADIPFQDETTAEQRMIKFWADRFESSQNDVKRLEIDLAASRAYAHDLKVNRDAWEKQAETQKDQSAKWRGNFQTLLELLRSNT